MAGQNIQHPYLVSSFKFRIPAPYVKAGVLKVIPVVEKFAFVFFVKLFCAKPVKIDHFTSNDKKVFLKYKTPD